MGWLGWSEDQALRADVNAIEVAFIGKRSMLRAIYGGPEEPQEVGPMTADRFDAMFGDE